MPSRAAIQDPPKAVAFDIGRSLPDEQTCVVVVEGRLDLAGAPRLKWMLLEAYEAGCSQLVVDLSRHARRRDGRRRADRRAQRHR